MMRSQSRTEKIPVTVLLHRFRFADMDPSGRLAGTGFIHDIAATYTTTPG